MSQSLRVHVCIDQPYQDRGTSGLVGSWTHFWREAARHPELDVTGHTVGPRRRRRVLAPNVRVFEHPLPVSITRCLAAAGFETPTRVGLFPYHRGLASHLRGADVIHTTYTYLSFAMTALWVSRRAHIPLVNSLQTHVPLHSEIYAQRLAGRVFGRTFLRGPLVERRGFSHTLRRFFDGQLAWYLRRCNRVLISAPDDVDKLPRDYPRDRVSYLARGIDKAQFNPDRRDRSRLVEWFGIPEGTPVVLFVGRIMPEKNVLTLARALAILRDRGEAFTLLVCGKGDQREDVQALLGDRVVFAGVQHREALATIYASCDVFAFPSTTEMYANVVMEAMGAGLPPVVSGQEGAKQHVGRPGCDGIVVDRDSPEEWAEALGALLRDPERRRSMGAAARKRIEEAYASWAGIFEGTLKPAWVAAGREGTTVGPCWPPAATGRPVRTRR